MGTDRQKISKLQANIISRARSFIGIQEVPPNLGFNNSVFQSLMEGVGWRRGWAWCALFAELVWKSGYEDTYKDRRDIIKMIDKLFSANSQATYLGFAESPEFEVSDIPEIADIGIYKLGKVTGHTVIVNGTVDSSHITTIEGNSKDCVNDKNIRRTAGWGNYTLMGFIKPKLFV